jgi:hypothetical protein
VGAVAYLFPISYSTPLPLNSTGYALTYTVKSTAVLKLAQVREFYRYYLPEYVSDSPSNVSMYFMNYGDREIVV